MQAVDRIQPPSLDDFRRLYVRASRPVVIRGLTDDWRTRAWSPDALAERHPALRLPVARTRDGRLLTDPRSGIRYRRAALGDFVRSLRSDAPSEYLITSDRELPADLREEITRPRYSCRALWQA